MQLNRRTDLTGIYRIGNLVLPGFDGVPLSHVFIFVVRGFRKGGFVIRDFVTHRDAMWLNLPIRSEETA